MLNLLILGLLVLAVFLKVSAIYPVGVNNEYFRESMPVDAVAYLKTHILPGRLFNSYNWGGYLLWALPEYPVFVDGRTDLYNDEVIDEWLSVYQGQSGWTDVFIKYSINLALIEAGSTLDRSLADRQDWREIYRDKIAVIYQRVDQ